jgi:cobalt-zinc-cadmium efflux system membrane fusion protein
VKRAHTLASLTTALLIAGCGSKPPEAVQAVAKVAEEKPSATEVVLNPAQIAEARISSEPVRERTLPLTIRATGRVAINENRTWRVGAITDGRAVMVVVNVGDSVKEGQTLARLHSHDVHEGRAAYQKARSEMARWKAQEVHTRRTRDRMKRLYELKAGSLEQLDHAEADLRNAEEALRQAEFEIERSKTHLIDFLNVELDEPSHHKAGEHGAEDQVPVKAPAPGIVLIRNVTVGTVVQPGTEMFVITDPTTLWVIAAVAEADLGRLRIGMPVSVSVQAYPDRTFRGRLVKLDEKLDPETRTIQARIEVPNAGGELKPEMYADAGLETASGQPALLVPETAIHELKGQQVVFVEKSPGRFEPAAIVTGRQMNGQVEVSEGLRPADRVVIRGGFMLKSQLLRRSLDEE